MIGRDSKPRRAAGNDGQGQGTQRDRMPLKLSSLTEARLMLPAVSGTAVSFRSPSATRQSPR